MSSILLQKNKKKFKASVFLSDQMLSRRIQKSLLETSQNNLENQRFTISIQNQDSKIFSVDMMLDNYTVEETMRIAIAKINNLHNLSLNQDLDQYEMYGARKNGKKKSDLPALSKGQNITKIGLKRFTLCPLWMRQKKNSMGELCSIKSIATNFAPSRKLKQLSQRPTIRNSIGCFCIC